MKIRKLPDYEGVADNMGDFFIPTDCGENEMLIRAGKIKSQSEGSVYAVMAYTPKTSEWGWNLRVRCLYSDGWGDDKYMVTSAAFDTEFMKHIPNR
jgi:hypothetical protein